MKLYLSWTTFKAHITDKARLRYDDRGDFYKLDYPDDGDGLESSILKDSGADQTDFDTNYKTSANKKIAIPTQIDTFTAKVAGAKKLYTRTHGITFSAAIGDNNIDYNIPYDLVKFNALEIIGAELGDTASLQVLDTPTGTFSTVPNFMLNQFGFTVNLPTGFYARESKYDADLIKDMKIRVIYNSVSAKTVRINFVLHELKT